MSKGLAEAPQLPHPAEPEAGGPPTLIPHPPTCGWAGAGQPDPCGEGMSPRQPELQTQGRGAPGHRVGGGKVLLVAAFPWPLPPHYS